jgi:hypothetical protein
MESKGAGSRFLQSRAVEEPLEASVELGEQIKIIATKALLPLNLGLLAFILMILLTIPSIYDILLYVWQGLRGDSDFTTKLLGNVLVSLAIIIFLYGILVTAFLYMTQITNFISRNLLKCCKISDLTNVKIAEEKGVRKGSIKGKHLKNPIFAVMDLEEESMHVLPQIVKMLRFCVFFIAIAIVILILTIVLYLGFDYNLMYSFDLIRLGVGVLVVIKSFIVLKLLMDVETNFRYIHTRHNIIDSVRFEKSISVPKGEDPIHRLIVYLEKSDPYIRSSHLAEKSDFSQNVKLKGSSGKDHQFDGYFEGMNILKDKSVALGMPMGKFGVFIKVFKEEIALPKIKALKDSAMDVCRYQGMYPLRIIALQWSLSDIPDDVYDYVLENPILTKNMLTHIEIIGEDGEIYSFIPMISYGEKRSS